jgi:hypothetical protein
MKRQDIAVVCTAAVMLNVISAVACFNAADRWAAGIVWNNGEKVEFSQLDLLGQTGTAITKSGNGDSTVYKYQSHFAPGKAMVYLDRYTPAMGTAGSFPRIAVIADSAAAGTSFNFGAALRVELDWLCCPELGALDMPLVKRRAAVAAVTAGNSQYWTRQCRALSYNQWFTGDTLNGTWGTNGVKGSCGLDAAYDPPSGQLGIAVPLDTFRTGASSANFAVVNTRTGTTRQVAAIRETSGMYYLPFMSRVPEFYNKLFTGYFDYDSLSTGRWDSVFIVLALVGTATAAERKPAVFSAGSSVNRPLSRRAMVYNLRGCRVDRSSGVVLLHDGARLTRRIVALH